MINAFFDRSLFVAKNLGIKTIKMKHIIVKIICDGLERLKSFIYKEFTMEILADSRNLIHRKGFECQLHLDVPQRYQYHFHNHRQKSR